MELAVIDASVAAKWVIAEPGTEAANDLLSGELRLYAPSLVRVEVAGVALRCFRLKSLDERAARAACHTWDRLIDDGFLMLLPTSDLYRQAVSIAFDCRHPLADCLYIAAAITMDCKLLTADQSLYERGRSVHDRIELMAAA